MSPSPAASVDLSVPPEAGGVAGGGLVVRWLGRVTYDDALVLQRRLFANKARNYLLLLEHPHVVTLGRRGRDDHLLGGRQWLESQGATVVHTDRGGEVTYHGPGQLVGYPILNVPGKRGGGMADTAAYVAGVEQLLIDVLAGLGIEAGRVARHTGVWVDPEGWRPRKIAAIGVRLARARSMHGFALNVSTDLDWFKRIVPCGITDLGVTSLATEGVDASMREVVDLVVDAAAQRWSGGGPVDRADVAHRVTPEDLAVFTREALTATGADVDQQPEANGNFATPAGTRGSRVDIRPGQSVDSGLDQTAGVAPRLAGRLTQAGVDSAAAVPFRSRKPEWMKVKLNTGGEFRRLRSTLRDLNLVTVCEEAGCPNISECWNDGTATFMILGERCTRACGFCLVDTRKPGPPDPDEPFRVAQAAVRMGLEHVVVTMVARDDLADGGAQAVVEVIAAVRERLPDARVETLISDLGGNPEALRRVFDARPDVLNHNIETVARLQRAVRPSAGYARSLAVLARAKAAGLVTKSSIIVGMGETHHEIVQTLADLRDVGCDIVTIGQYLRPSERHLPVAQWWPPEAFDRWKALGESMGIGHIEASPLTRSSYHAKAAANAAQAAEANPPTS